MGELINKLYCIVCIVIFGLQEVTDEGKGPTDRSVVSEEKMFSYCHNGAPFHPPMFFCSTLQSLVG